VWDQGFFYDMGLDCIRRDGLGHVSRLLGNVSDATATTTPFPLVNLPFERKVAEATNRVYILALPLILLAVAALFLLRRTAAREWSGQRALLLHLACLLPVLLVYDSEPRFRIPYDAFGLALLASVVVAGVEAARRRSRKRSLLGEPPGRSS
jgi:4-amino-4-deoxy-L-arabinose transferase-like glycosyltransferase